MKNYNRDNRDNKEKNNNRDSKSYKKDEASHDFNRKQRNLKTTESLEFEEEYFVDFLE